VASWDSEGSISCKLQNLGGSSRSSGYFWPFTLLLLVFGVYYSVVNRVEFDFGRSNRLYFRVSDGQKGKHKKQGALHNSVKCPPAAAYLACESVSGQKKQSLKRDSAVCAETDSAETCARNVGKS